jgi:hypothetical protein
MSNPIFVSYHTGSPYYAGCAKKLVTQIEILGGKIIMDKIHDTGYYWKNTLRKPKFILDKLNEIKEDIIWIDADTNLLGYTDCMKNWKSDIFAASHTGDLHGIKASPLGIKYNERNLELFSRFSEICNFKISVNDVDLDHDVLKYEILPLFKEKISIEILGCGGSSVDYTDGKYIRNGVSRALNKGAETKITMAKNQKRSDLFNSLSLVNFKNYG